MTLRRRCVPRSSEADVTAHGQAGIVALCDGLAVIEANTLVQAALILGTAAVVAAVILIAGRL